MDTKPQGWDNTAEDYLRLDLEVGFTAQYAADALQLSVGDRPADGLKILDVATGTGALSVKAAKLNPRCKVLAVDFSPKMIEMLNQRKAKENLTNLETAIMDGQHLTLEDNSFDAAYSLFGLIFFQDRKKGFKELYRVLKPGGKVGVSTYTKDMGMSLLSQRAMAIAGISVSFAAAAPLYSLAEDGVFETELREAGFKDIEIHAIEHNLVAPSMDLFVDTFKSNPVMRNAVKELTEEQIQKFKEGMRQAEREMKDNMVTKVLIGIATK
jgi:ubiquinone/menaquinone biosynthesis C-methylase UbiE